MWYFATPHMAMDLFVEDSYVASHLIHPWRAGLRQAVGASVCVPFVGIIFVGDGLVPTEWFGLA